MQPRTKADDRYGFRQLEPVPSAGVLSEFYAQQYYELLKGGERFPEARRLMSGGGEADLERKWLRETLYNDVLDIIKSGPAPGIVVDVGCGLGEMVGFLRDQGVDAFGVEPSESAVATARSAGRPVEQGNLEDAAELLGISATSSVAAILMMNVLEHVVDPVKIVRSAKSLLKPEGIICVRVPNDFSELQRAAQSKLGVDPWWIRTPDHINYFDWESLSRLLEGEGFSIVTAQADFPMEFFLLMGENYVDDQQEGARCHHRRVSFELALPTSVRRKLYRSLATAGMGRTCMIAARRDAVVR